MGKKAFSYFAITPTVKVTCGKGGIHKQYITTMKALIYLAAGVALGILIAPEKGDETRRRLMNKIDDASGGSKDFFGDAASDIKAQGKHLATDVENVAEKF